MPKIFILEESGVAIFDIDDDATVSALVRPFRVSLSAMQFRFANLFA